MPGSIVTFYSYKGGAGRTMALANAACLLAAAGHKVLAIDWDLEAPGLHRYLHPFLADPDLSKTPGIIDLVWDYAAAAARTASDDRREFNPLLLADPAHVATPTSFPMEGPGAKGCLHMIGAGVQNSVYADRVRNFDWAAMFSRLNGADFTIRFGEKCRTAYDFTLIDSRTGIADTAGIATVVLPDRVVLCFTPNRQSVLGIRAIGKSILAARPLLPLLPVVTRVEKGVEGWREAQIFYRSELDDLLPGTASEAMRAAYWGAAEIVHYPNYALGELLATFCDSPTEQNSLLSDMRRLVSRIIESQFMSSRENFDAPELTEQARKHYLRRVQFRDPRIADLQAALDGDPSSGLLSVLSVAADASREADSGAEWQKQLASTLNSLGIRLSSLGRSDEAVSASQKAVEVYRRLEQTRPNTFLSELASSLTNLGADLSSLGRREEALAASKEAVDIRKRLSHTQPDANLPDLATGLNNLSVHLSELGRLEEALVTAQDAVDIRRRLAETQPGAILPDLARSLNNLEVIHSGLGRREKALAAAREAVDIRRHLAKTRPDAFLPDLAAGLNSLGAGLFALERPEEALKAIQEAVEIYRRLTETRPDTYLPDLASSLNISGTILSSLERRKEALSATQEVVEIRRRLALTRPADVPNIFISCSPQHRDLARKLTAAMEAHFGAGSVWWDQTELRTGDSFSEAVTRALDAAKAVVVVWTHGAIASDWVYAEAVRAATQRKLVSVRAVDLDPSLVPPPFHVFHTCVVDDTRAVLLAIEKRLSGEVPELVSDSYNRGFRSFLLDPKQEALPVRASATRPASLLLAKHRLVPFDDIHGLRDEFVRWATGSPAHALGRTALGRLVHSPAGLGKTRGLIEIADELTRAHGWLAGFVPRDVRGAERELSEAAFERLILCGRDAAGLLLIVDYAESRQEDVVWLADRLVRRAESIARPARLVLLSRGSGEWWWELVRKSQSLQDLCSLGGDSYDEIEIPEQIARRDRRALFDASVKAFLAHRSSITAKSAEVPPPSDALVHSLETENDYDRPLAVQIAALLHVAGREPAEGRHSMAGLLEKILGLEYEHWDKVLEIGDRPNLQAAVKNGVAQVTLVGGVENAQAAEALIQGDPLFRDATDIDVLRVRGSLSLIFPTANGGLDGLEPDLIGEHHILNVIATDALVDACLAWAGENGEQRRHILTVLNRATRDEHGPKASRAEARLGRLVRTQAAALGGDLVNVAIETPGKLLDLCPGMQGELEHLDETSLAAINDALPLQSLALMDLSLSVAERRAELARKEALAQNSDAAAHAAADAAPDVREHVLHRLSARVGILCIRLSNLGRLEEALAASQEAVDITRRLTQTRPDAFLLDLAMSLNSSGVMLSNLGRGEEALAASQEAVDIYRRLAQTRPDAFLPGLLANSLNNLGIRLSNLGRGEEALAASQEAVDIYRRLAQTRPDAFLPDLAMSLNSSGMMLSNLGRREEALAASREAVDIRRRLAQMRPDAFLPDLAFSLNNLGGDLSNLGRREEALAASQEAVDIRRRLAQMRPDAFLPNLALSLNNLGMMLSALGRREGALAASQEAVDIYRRLAQTRPDAFLPNLASSLNNSGAMLSNLGRLEEALAASQEAVDINRRLAQTRPDAFSPDLARSISVMSDALAALDRRPEAAQAASEALAILLPFVERYADAYRSLAHTIVADVRQYSEATGTAPNSALLERAARALDT